MKLLLTGEKVCQLDTDTGIYSIHTLVPERVQLGVEKYKGNYIFPITTTKRYKGPSEGYLVFTDTNFNIICRVDPPAEFQFEHTHQIRIHNDELFITDTQHDRIIVYHLDKRTWRELIVVPGMGYTKHINGLFFNNGFLYVMCHNLGHSCIRIYDANENFVEEKTNTGMYAHNTWEMDGKIWYCDSHNGSISSLQGDNIRMAGGGFLRGIAITDTELAIGNTPNYNIPVEYLHTVKLADQHNASVYVLDRTLAIKKEIVIVGLFRIVDMALA